MESTLLAMINQKDEVIQQMIHDKDHTIQQLIHDKDEVIHQKDHTIQQLIHDKDEVIHQKDQTIQQLIHDKDQMIQKLIQQKDQMSEELRQLERKALNQKHELNNKITDYLRVTKSLHIRCVCEEFEATNPVLINKEKSRRLKWAEMLKSEDDKSVEFRECLVKCGLNVKDVPQLAKELFDKINDDVHKDFRTSNEALHVVKNYFTPDEFKLVQCIIDCYGITSVKIVDTAETVDNNVDNN